MTLRLKVNDVEVEARPGEGLLDVARREGFSIPSLCHIESLPAIGACRVCLVSIKKGKRTKLTTACNYQVLDGIEVTTDSPEIHAQRAINLELLLARAPGSEAVRELAARYGVTRPRFGPLTYNPLPNCILCELCVRACAVLGHHALTVVGRGDRKRVGLPFNKPAESCVGCGSCVSVCPTSCIPMKDTAATRTIWGQSFDFVKCTECGAPVITVRHRASAITNKALPEDYYDVCESCKQVAASQRFAAIVW
jgi:NADH dehydrogenase/NADH:ubiquinone oxidoreductase subunit G